MEKRSKPHEKRKRSSRKIWCILLCLLLTLLPFGAAAQEPDGGTVCETTSGQETYAAEEAAGEPTPDAAGQAPEEDGPEITATSAILMDAKTGTVLFEKNAKEPLPPASVTKVMSMLLVMEAVDSGQISLEDEVTISERAAEMGGSQLYMEPGETHSVGELMKGVAMASANDGCVAFHFQRIGEKRRWPAS